MTWSKAREKKSLSPMSCTNSRFAALQRRQIRLEGFLFLDLCHMKLNRKLKFSATRSVWDRENLEKSGPGQSSGGKKKFKKSRRHQPVRHHCHVRTCEKMDVCRDMRATLRQAVVTHSCQVYGASSLAWRRPGLKIVRGHKDVHK